MKFSIGLRVKVIALLLSMLIILFASITYALVTQNTNTLRSNLAEQSKSFASLATQPIGDAFVLYKDSGRIRIKQQVERSAGLSPDIIGVRIVDVAGTELFNSSDEMVKMPINADLASSFEPQYIHNEKGELTQIIQPYIEGSGAHRYSIIYQISNERVNENIEQVVRLILYIGLSVLILSSLITIILMNRLFLRPIAQVSSSAKKISEGDLNRQISSNRRDEIGELATAVNAMANSLKADIAKLREVDKLKSEFLMITSHNLRTPITIIKGYLEQASLAKEIGQLRKILETISVSATRLNVFAEDVLTISTLESDKTILQKEPTKPAQLLEGIAGEFSKLAAKKPLGFKSKINLDDLQVDISVPHFRSAIWNLLDNAYKFTKENDSVLLEAKMQDGSMVIRISDSGIGIDANEIPKLFTKFHRATSTLKYDYEGVGIGLYLTKLIVEQHGGNVGVQSELGKGSAFTIKIPI